MPIIKVVPDTNTIISGMISAKGAARKIINLAIAKRIILYGSEISYLEFCEKIEISRLSKYLEKQHFSSQKIIADYRSIITIIHPNELLEKLKIVRDKDDDEFIRIAIASNSNIILSRDKDLLSIKRFKDIRIIDIEQFLKIWYRIHGGNLFKEKFPK